MSELLVKALLLLFFVVFKETSMLPSI